MVEVIITTYILVSWHSITQFSLEKIIFTSENYKNGCKKDCFLKKKETQYVKFYKKYNLNTRKYKLCKNIKTASVQLP